MKERTVCLLLGYICGCFLTAEVVARRVAGKSAAELGETGNPGMANIMASLGFAPGIVTLIGDLGKCIVAALAAYALFRGNGAGRIVMLYAGVGCTVGHDFPFWRKFRGGKGVATTSIAICLYAFFPGLFANIVGMVAVFATKYLCIGGPVIPLTFTVWMLAAGDYEAAVLGAVLSVLSIAAHGPSVLGIRSGRTKQTDVIGAIRRKLG